LRLQPHERWDPLASKVAAEADVGEQADSNAGLKLRPFHPERVVVDQAVVRDHRFADPTDLERVRNPHPVRRRGHPEEVPGLQDLGRRADAVQDGGGCRLLVEEQAGPESLGPGDRLHVDSIIHAASQRRRRGRAIGLPVEHVATDMKRNALWDSALVTTWKLEEHQ
jgi:hypothetical protein